MGHSDSGTMRVWRRALLVAALVVGFAVAAAPAQAVEIGVSDSDAPTLNETHWDGLSLRRIRIVVPYDVATTTGERGRRRRTAFENARTAAIAKGVQLLVVFGPSADLRAPDTGYPIAPTADEYQAGVAAFVQRYPDVTTIGAWNEPNNPDAHTYPLSGDPWLAAEYWLRAQAVCPACTIVAGEFAGIPNDDAYVDAYQAALGGARPAVWAFHAHGDVNSFQASGPDSARISRYYIGKLQGQWAGSRIWIDEVGARFRDPSGSVWGDASQQEATKFLLGLATLDPRIDAIYYYNYSNQCSTPSLCAVQDRGLVSPTPFDGQPLDYDGTNRRRPAWDVIANRGPVIAPAQLVPPVVTIDTPAQSSVLGRANPTFAGQAAVGGRAADSVTLQIFPGAASTQGSTPIQTVTARVQAGRWTATVAPLRDGTYTAQASQVGNRTSAGISQDLVFTIDTVAPTSTITAGPPAVTGERSATVSFAASEPAATFVCSLDRARAVPCTSPLSLSRLALGGHSVGVRAIDAAGNVQRTPTRYTWQVVALATALAPRTGDLATTLTSGLPIAASCADRCRVDARLYAPRAAARAVGLAGRAVSRRDPGRPRGKGYVMLARDSVVRSRAGGATLALRLRGGAATRRARAVTLRLGLVLSTARGSRPLVVSRRVSLVRAGALRAVAKNGLPVTVACSSVCSARTALWVPRTLARTLRAPGRSVVGDSRKGLPRGGRYVSLSSETVRRTRGGATDVTFAVPRTVRARLPRLATAGVRVAGLASGPGAATQPLAWSLVLPR